MPPKSKSRSLTQKKSKQPPKKSSRTTKVRSAPSNGETSQPKRQRTTRASKISVDNDEGANNQQSERQDGGQPDPLDDDPFDSTNDPSDLPTTEDYSSPETMKRWPISRIREYLAKNPPDNPHRVTETQAAEARALQQEHEHKLLLWSLASGTLPHILKTYL